MQTLSAVAAEYTHAVLNVVSAEGIPQQDGHVQQSGQLQHEAVPDDSSAADNVATDGDRRSQATLGRTICARDKCGTCSGPPAARGTRRLDEAAVSAEAAKVKANFATLPARTSPYDLIACRMSTPRSDFSTCYSEVPA